MSGRTSMMSGFAVALLGLSVACGGVIDAQGKAQAQSLNEKAAKVKQAKGDGAASAAIALETLATGLESGSLTLKQSKALLAEVDAAVEDGEVTAAESAGIAKNIAENSKARSK